MKDIYPAYFQSGVVRAELLGILRRDGSEAKILLSMNAYRGDKGRIERSVCLIDQPVSVNVEQPVTVVDDQRFKGAFEHAVHGIALVAPTARSASPTSPSGR